MARDLSAFDPTSPKDFRTVLASGFGGCSGDFQMTGSFLGVGASENWFCDFRVGLSRATSPDRLVASSLDGTTGVTESGIWGSANGGS